MAKGSVCFFARVPNVNALRQVEFYAQDLQILRELGFDVRIAIRPQDIRPADLFFVWWWSSGSIPVWIANRLRRPAVVTGTFDHSDYQRRPPWQQLLMQYTLRSARVNVFVSDLERTLIPRLFRTCNPHYVPHIVDTTVYVPGRRERERFIFTVAWMQTLNARRKCLPELLQAAAYICKTHADVRFVIAGERGSSYPGLAAQVRELGIQDRVDFLGSISRERKIELMQRCAVYLQPSRYEGFGLAILEAMSCGAPVVTSPAGAVPEVVGDAAVLVDGTIPERIAEALDDLLAHPDRRLALSQQARVRAESSFPFARRRKDLGEILERL